MTWVLWIALAALMALLGYTTVAECLISRRLRRATTAYAVVWCALWLTWRLT